MKIKYILIFCLGLYFPIGYAEQNYVKWDCKKPPLEFPDDSNTCTMYILDNQKYIIVAQKDAGEMLNTTLTYYSKNLFSYETNYGGSSKMTIFYELSTRRKSENFEPVYMIDLTHNLAIIGNSDGVIFTSIFKDENSVKEILIPQSDISIPGSAAPDPVQVKFQDNKVYVDYQDKNQKPQSKVFELKGFTPSDQVIQKNS